MAALSVSHVTLADMAGELQADYARWKRNATRIESDELGSIAATVSSLTDEQAADLMAGFHELYTGLLSVWKRMRNEGWAPMSADERLVAIVADSMQTEV